MPRSEVYFAIPSANPENCRKHLPAWREMGYKIAVLQDHKKVDVPADIVVQYGDYRGWPASVNALCLEVVPKTAAIVVTGGDDMLPDPHFSAEQLAAQFLKRFPDSFGVMQPHGDNYLDTTQYCGSPWLGRNWFTKMYQGKGGLSAAYHHMFADDELFWVAGCWGALWTRPELVQRHEHFCRRGGEKPEYWERNAQSSEAADTAMFIARSSRGFPDHGPLEEIAGHRFNRDFFVNKYDGRAQRHWNTAIAHQYPTVAEMRVAAAMEACARHGKKRVVIFGAGRHTRRLASVLLTPPVQVIGIVDENPGLAGTRMWNYPILSVAQAAALKPDAVILSSDTVEEKLSAAAGPLAAAGAEIVRLYTTEASAA